MVSMWTRTYPDYLGSRWYLCGPALMGVIWFPDGIFMGPQVGTTWFSDGADVGLHGCFPYGFQVGFMWIRANGNQMGSMWDRPRSASINTIWFPDGAKVG